MKKILAIIVIVIVCVCLFSRSCSKIEKTSRTIRFTELDKSIQDTLHSVWQTIHNVFREEDKVDLIDFTNDYVFVTRQDFFLKWVFHPVIINASYGWEYEFSTSELQTPVIIKGNTMYIPVENYYFLPTEQLDSSYFYVYNIKEGN